MASRYMEDRVQCPACQSAVVRSVYSCDYYEPPVKDYLIRFYASQGGVDFDYLRGAKYELRECRACGMVYQGEVPNDELMLMLYEQWIDPQLAYLRHLNEVGLHLYSYYAQEVMQILGHLGELPSKIEVLDFGMGWGRWARMAQAFGCVAAGCELSPSRIDYADRHGIRTVDWDAIPDNSFNLVNTDQVFEHIPDPLATLQHLVKGLAPGGLIKIDVPDGTSIRRRLAHMDWEAPIGSSRSLHAVAPLEHINCFSRSCLIEMANAVNLEPVYIPVHLQYRFVTGWQGVKRCMKNLLLPVYRNVLRKGTYLFFRLRS